MQQAFCWEFLSSFIFSATFYYSLTNVERDMNLSGKIRLCFNNREPQTWSGLKLQRLPLFVGYFVFVS